jgi:hypothetical protein
MIVIVMTPLVWLLALVGMLIVAGLLCLVFGKPKF